ncbi:Rieske (2Fe-2S) protein [Thiolapillus sp.]|uniref:Rieske (2Fe-2S) protein n=1 Tax=Thiolapillus sp. TaxID=2017437 RepID=UPI0025DD0059|nr:Rieske 2Fe-2S domain-containing protein [Thiolapillus sp.]
MSARAICKLSDLKDKDARGYRLVLDDGGEFSLIVVREGDLVFVYRNRCPHTGINLEWQPDRFFDLGGAFLQCATHGALFRLEDGYCVRGPCAGDSLESVSAWVIEGQVVVDA